MSSKVLCDIPIYTIDKEKFMTLVKQKRTDRFKELLAYGNDENSSKKYSHQEMVKFANWKYNQMIGYIEIEIKNKDVIFNLYLTDEKRHRYFSNVKKYINFVPTVGLHFWTDDKNSEEIKEEIYCFLNMIKKDFIHIGNVYFDMSTFELIIRYIDLKKYIEE